MSSPNEGEEPTRPPHTPVPEERPGAEPTQPLGAQPAPPPGQGPYIPYDEAAARAGSPPHQEQAQGWPPGPPQGPVPPHGQQPPHQGAHQPAQAPQGQFQHGHLQPAAAYQSAPATRRKGPGWAGAFGIAVVAALLAGLFGGLLGGLLAGRSDSGGGPTIVDSDHAKASDRPDGSIAKIAADAVPSVVTVRVSGASGSGTGSGWVYDERGHIITNNHVVRGAGNGARVGIEMADGTRREAKVVGTDTSYDVAVLKVDPKGLEPLDIGKSEDVVVGDEVVAVGSPLGLGSTVTAGIVSAMDRPVNAGEPGAESFISAIQTDAAINPGNSGGPLLNRSGDVIGVNSAIAQVPGQDSASGSIGVGFAIPSDVVVRIADQLIKTGKAVHPIIGVSLDRRWSGEGAKVMEEDDVPAGEEAVIPGGPADKAGIEPGDVIVAMDGRRITDLDQLVVRIRAKAVGDEVTLKVKRGGEEERLTMTLEAAKES